MKLFSIDIHLKNGTVICGKIEEDDYISVYEDWIFNRIKILNFSNCSVRSEDVSALVWELDDKYLL